MAHATGRARSRAGSARHRALRIARELPSRLARGAAAPFLLPPSALPVPRDIWESVALFEDDPVGKNLFSELDPRFVLAQTTGLVLCLSDANSTLRALLRALEVSPPPPFDEPIEPSKYLRGGLVGAVERLLIYVFTANMAFNAIAFVITVKGIVRYQEIVKHHSAEYVLIGSLLAMLLGMLFARIACGRRRRRAPRQAPLDAPSTRPCGRPGTGSGTTSRRPCGTP